MSEPSVNDWLDSFAEPLSPRQRESVFNGVMAEARRAQAEQEAAADLRAERDALLRDFEHMARFRHDEAHNGDIYRGGDFPCSLCPASLQVLAATPDTTTKETVDD